MKTKTPWTLEQHIEVGQQLAQMQDTLTKLPTELSRSYSVNARAVKRAIKAIDALHNLRCELDEVLYRERKAPAGTRLCYVYYPPRAGEETRAVPPGVKVREE